MAVFNNPITDMTDINEIETRLIEARARAAALESELEAARNLELAKELEDLFEQVRHREALESHVAKVNRLIADQGLTVIIRRQRGAKAPLDACEENP